MTPFRTFNCSMRPHVNVFVRVHACAPVCKLFISGWSNFCIFVGHFSKLFKFAGLNRLKTLICFKIKVFSKKKKKRSSLGVDLQNSYFHPKIKVFSKKKKKVFTWNRSPKFLFSSQNHSVLQKKKVAAACDRQDLCKIVPRARSWNTLTYIMTIPQRPHLIITPTPFGVATPGLGIPGIDTVRRISMFFGNLCFNCLKRHNKNFLHRSLIQISSSRVILHMFFSSVIFASNLYPRYGRGSKYSSILHFNTSTL